MSVIKRKIDVPDTIDLYTTATLKTMGNIQEISLSSNRNNGKTIVPLSKEEFVVVSTGEVKKLQTDECRPTVLSVGRRYGCRAFFFVHFPAKYHLQSTLSVIGLRFYRTGGK